jgi:hypothetical protein
MEIPKAKELEQKVFAIHNEEAFHSIAWEVYHFQFHHNPLYRQYCQALGRSPETEGRLTDIPFLPISFFKSHRVATTAFEPALIFKSSGTTASTPALHYIKDPGLYEKSFLTGFSRCYGNIEDYCILGLLPSYLERGQSSLVYMVAELIKKSKQEQSGFYLHDFRRLDQTLKALEGAGQKTLLIGVTYALLDFSAEFPQNLSAAMVMETGGMKGRGQEMTREQLYGQLKKQLGASRIHSEYGMTELLSQAYALEGRFSPPPWMKVLLRDETDPFAIYDPARPASGAINVIDLANLYSCCFIATEDLGNSFPGGHFEVLGRLDNSDIRGCSLLAT